MLSCEAFYNKLKEQDVSFFTGVPDSLLKDFCAYVTKNADSKEHIIAANEGNSIALAAGHHMATGKVPLVYLQNSGLGNIVNPILSLADKEVFSIPMLIMIGWRGEPGVKDEPQHVKQGKVTTAMLESMGVKYQVISQEDEKAHREIEELVSHAKEMQEPVALLIQKGTFDSYKLDSQKEDEIEMTREEAIEYVSAKLGSDPLILSTTGKISRELYESRVLKQKVDCEDFLNVGAMGHVSQVALGVALSKPEKKVACFDGDGAFLMHMGGAAIISTQAPENYFHFIFNNASHDSVGGQPTIARDISLLEIAKACRYRECYSLRNKEDIDHFFANFHNITGPVFVEVHVQKGARSDLGRPKTTPLENKKNFINKVNK